MRRAHVLLALLLVLAVASALAETKGGERSIRLGVLSR